MIKLAKTTYVLIHLNKRDDGLYRSISYIQKTNNKILKLILAFKRILAIKIREYHMKSKSSNIYIYYFLMIN